MKDFGIIDEDYKVRNHLRYKDCMALYCSMQKPKVTQICTQRLSVFFNMGSKLEKIKYVFQVYIMNVNNMKRAFKKHCEKKNTIIEEFRVEWTKEIFASETWERSMKSKRTARKIPNVPWNIINNSGFINEKVFFFHIFDI